MRPGNPDRFAAAVDEMDRSLDQIAKLRSRTPSLRLYQPFETYWDRIRVMSMDMKMSRMEYNQRARLYNGLLRAFPQNMISSLFGFVPLSIYGTNQNI
jgi:LemA protein